MSSAHPAGNWLEQEAAPAIRAGIATVARRALALDAFTRWPDEWQEAFQNAALKVWRSAAARALAEQGRWEELRKFSHRAGHNAGIDVLRDRYGGPPLETYAGDMEGEATPHLPAPPRERPDTVALREDLRRELQLLLADLSSVVPALPQSAEHPSRQILGLYLQLLDQELKAAVDAQPGDASIPQVDATGAPFASWNHATGRQRPTQEDPLFASWVRLLVGADRALPTYREQRLDLQVATILRPDQVAGERASDDTRRQAGQWVRTELSRARKRLRALYEERYHRVLTW